MSTRALGGIYPKRAPSLDGRRYSRQGGKKWKRTPVKKPPHPFLVMIFATLATLMGVALLAWALGETILRYHH